MNLRLPSRSAFGPWLMSLPATLLLPVLIWIAPAVFRGTFNGFSMYNLRESGMLIAIHLAGYAVLGLPLFLRCYRSPGALIWFFPLAIPVGAVLGVIGVGAFVIWGEWAFPGPLNLTRFPGTYLIGLGYGVCTAVTAWLARPEKPGKGGRISALP